MTADSTRTGPTRLAEHSQWPQYSSIKLVDLSKFLTVDIDTVPRLLPTVVLFNISLLASK